MRAPGFISVERGCNIQLTVEAHKQMSLRNTNSRDDSGKDLTRSHFLVEGGRQGKATAHTLHRPPVCSPSTGQAPLPSVAASPSSFTLTPVPTCRPSLAHWTGVGAVSQTVRHFWPSCFPLGHADLELRTVPHRLHGALISARRR